MTWSTAAPAISAAFLASLVEVVEAFTIVLAVATLRGWRPVNAGHDRRPHRAGRHRPAAGAASRPRPDYLAAAGHRHPVAALRHGLAQEGVVAGGRRHSVAR